MLSWAFCKSESTAAGSVKSTYFIKVDHLKERLIEEWRHTDHGISDRAVNKWQKRLCVSVRTEDTVNINLKRGDCYHFLGWQQLHSVVEFLGDFVYSLISESE